MAEEEEKDIISTLPDSILCHILSFLETIHAVTTSILSKRWKYLWLSVPVLDFDVQPTDLTTFLFFNASVYSVLLSRNPSLPIKKFKLALLYDGAEDINLPTLTFTKWINFVIQRGGLEHLDLFVHLPNVPKLPNTIFTCKTLVSLHLLFFYLDSNNSNFSSFQLPSLKTLRLSLIVFPNDIDFMLLLAACPILENLTIKNLRWFHSEEESLSCCNRWKSFSLSNLSRASVDSTYFHFPLKVLQNVQMLCISIAKVHSFNGVIPIFHNLTNLQINSLNYRWNFLVQVLKHCPMLQELCVDEAGPDATEETWTQNDDEENLVVPDVVPECLSLHLRSCHLLSYLSLPSEIMLAVYILKNARVLQTMVIWNGGKFLELERLLSLCPKASSTCKLTVHNVPFDDASEPNSPLDANEPNSPLDASGSSGGSNV
ncbi:FBD-associated F-box protein [Trifolium repens]|nr:FBD-associated F-box protein [Trifolium repens]